MPGDARYLSTRGRTDSVGFEAAVLMGLATDGGLLLPETVPTVTADLDAWRFLSYPDLAKAVMRPFIGSPGLPVQFLRPNAFQGNFYESLLRSLMNLLTS